GLVKRQQGWPRISDMGAEEIQTCLDRGEYAHRNHEPQQRRKVFVDGCSGVVVTGLGRAGGECVEDQRMASTRPWCHFLGSFKTGVRPALDSHRRSAQVLIQSTVELTTTAPRSRRMAYFQDSWKTMLVGYEFRRCDAAANSWRPAPRLDVHVDCLHAGITIEYFTRFVR